MLELGITSLKPLIKTLSCAETNELPSFETDSPLDYDIKASIIKEALCIVCPPPEEVTYDAREGVLLSACATHMSVLVS